MTTQVVPISDFHVRQADVLTKLDNGPVILAQRSRPAAILVSVFEWDKMVAELKRLRKYAEAFRQFEEISDGYFVDLDTLLAQRNGA